MVRSLGASLALFASAALADNPFPPYQVERTKILLTGEAAPGILGCTVASFVAPQIDGAGKVLIDGCVTGPGITSANDCAVWYGDESGLTLVIREGDPAPGIVGAFIAEPTVPDLSESGTIAMSCYLTGPSIDPALNARATFAGPPTGLQKIVQAGDAAPFTEPGTDFASSFFFGVQISDDGSLLLHYDLAGPAINSSNDRAMYVGYPDNPQLIWRRGTQAPGCEEGVVFSAASGVTFNDLQQISFRCTLTGSGVTSANDRGYWAGGAGQLQLVARRGFQAPDLPRGVNLFGTSFPGINTEGSIAIWGGLTGSGVTNLNNQAIWSGSPTTPSLIARRGDPAPGEPPGTTLSVVTVSGNAPINAEGCVAFEAALAGPSVTTSNDFVIYVHDLEVGTQIVMREGDSLPQIGSGVVVGQGTSEFGLNDAGDLVAATLLSGSDVEPGNDKVAWIRRPGGWWVPLLRAGETLDERIVVAASIDDLSPVANSTGGSDGIPQFMDDAGDVAALVSFSDGSKGIYRLRGSASFDVDMNGVLDIDDYALFPGCISGPDAPTNDSSCAALDTDLDGDVDLSDFQVLQEVFSSAGE